MNGYATRLRVPMELERFGGDDLLLPKIAVRLSMRGVTSPKFVGLVDTGASWVLASFTVARAVGLTLDQVYAAPFTLLGGLGGTRKGYRVESNLVLGEGAVPKRMLIPDVTVLFVEEPPAGHHLLIGQHGALSRLRFVQLAYESVPSFALAWP